MHCIVITPINLNPGTIGPRGTGLSQSIMFINKYYNQVCVELLANRSKMVQTKPFKSETSKDIRSQTHTFCVLQAETFFGPPFWPPWPHSFQWVCSLKLTATNILSWSKYIAICNDTNLVLTIFSRNLLESWACYINLWTYKCHLHILQAHADFKVSWRNSIRLSLYPIVTSTWE